SRTLLMNIHTLAWSDDLLAAMQVPRAVLPAIRASSEVYGEIAAGPLQGLPVAGDLGDQQAALFGQTCFATGEAKNTYGTGCFLLANTGERAAPATGGLLTTIAWDVGAGVRYALEGSAFITGAAVQWLRDGLRIIADAGETEALATSL